jgi:putative alpha-1,2-mannosidase
MIIDLPDPDPSKHGSRRLTIKAQGAPQKKYVKSLTVNGEQVVVPVLVHEQIAGGGDIVFEMSGKPEAWGNNPDIVRGLL